MSGSLGALAAAELLALKRPDGRIVIKDGIEWASTRKDTSALGRYLQWNDKICGQNWREFQCRQLIAIYIRDDQGQRSTIALTIDRKDGGGYREIQEAFDHEGMRQGALRDALAELNRIREKYEYLQELADVFAELDKVQQAQQPRQPRRRLMNEERTST